MGLTLSYAISIVGMFQWGVRQSAEVENLVSLLLDSLIRARDLAYTKLHKVGMK